MSISQYSPDGKFESGSFMNGMWSGPQGTNPNQGLMGLGQQPQGINPYATNRGLPMPQNPNYMGMSDAPFNPAMGMPQGEQYLQESWEVPPPFPDGYSDYLQSFQQFGLGNNNTPTGLTPQQWMANKPSAFNSGDTGSFNPPNPNGFNQPQAPYNNGKLRYDSYGSDSVMPQGYQQPTTNQFFQPMQQQPSNPVNTQSVQPNFMGQTPFGQPQTGQFNSSNPFVQAAQANAQGNIAGALQATAANRINQQTPYGSLSYQQTGTDAQGNPIWSANQNLSPELQQLTQSSLAGLQASQANPMYGINPGDTYSNAIMQRLAPQQSQAREALDAQLANQGIMPGSEAYNRAKVLQGQTQNDALTSAIVGGMNTGIQAQNLQNTTAANIRNLATPGYVTPYNQAAVAGPDYLSAYTSQNATDIARANAEAAQRSSLLGGLAGLGSSAILGGTGANSALGGLLGLGSQGLTALGNSSLYNSLFGTGPAITGDTNFLNSIGLGGSTYGSGTGGMTTDPLANLYTNGLSPEQNLSDLFNSSFGFGY